MFPLREDRRTYLFYALLLTLLALIAFGGLSRQLFDTDDFELLADASAASQDLSLLFSADRELPGRPVTELLFAGAYALWGEDPAGYHMLLVGLHLAASLLLAFTCRRLGADLELSLLTGLLFLVDVAHFRAVQWISCLAYPLALILGLATLLCFAHYLKSDQRRYLLVAALLQALAVGAHAAALCVAPFCAYLTWSRGRSGRHAALVAAPLLTTAALGAGWLHWLYPHTPQSRETFSALGGTQILGNLLDYLGRSLIQAHWLSAYGSEIQWAAGLLAGCGLVALLMRRVSPATDWAIWTLLALLPFTTRDTHDPSRYLYLASAGTALLWAWGLRRLAAHLDVWVTPRIRQFAGAGLLIALVVASLFSLRRAEALAFYYSGRAYGARSEQETSFELFNQAIARAPRLIPLDGYLRLATDGFLVGASSRSALEKGLEQYPGDPSLSMFLHISAFLCDDPQRHQRADQGIRAALSAAENAAQLRQLGAVAFQHLGLFHDRNGRPGLAIAAFDRALSLRPDYVLALCGRARVLQTQKRSQEAIASYRAAVQLRPDLAAAHYQLGILLLEQGDRPAAVAALQKTVELAPGSLQTWYVLSQLHRQAGDLDAARLAIRRALAGDATPQRYWTEYCDIGASYHARGAVDQALAIYREVANALPNYAGAYYNLGLLHMSQGRFAEAVTALQKVVKLYPDDDEARLALEQATRQMTEESVTAQRESRLLVSTF